MATSLNTQGTLEGANLASSGQNARLRGGAVALTIALVASAWMIDAEVARPFRLILFVPFFMSAILAYQGLFRTCPAHSKQGTRETEAGDVVRVMGESKCSAMHKSARSVFLASIITSVLATAVLFLIP